LGDFGHFRFPSTKDIASSLGLVNVPALVDSDVSDNGLLQIKTIGEQLKRDDFLKENGIQMVAHSPLKRARLTSLGMLGCMSPSDKDINVDRVEELDLLMEKTPAEWLPGNSGTLYSRIAQLENWLRAQPATKIVLVGHSQHFKAMLGLNFKFGNCDVWRLELDAPASADSKEEYGLLPRSWSRLKRLYTMSPTNTDAND
jgi:broad specificity phosphatase PhoE